MNITSVVLSIGAFLIMITMFARLNALNPREHKGWFWFLRRSSMLVSCSACAMVMAAPMTQSVPYWWELVSVMFVWGTFGVYFTSPQQKPWWDLIFGEHRRDPAESRRHFVQRELGVFWDGFRRESTERRTGSNDRRSGDDRRKNLQ